MVPMPANIGRTGAEAQSGSGTYEKRRPEEKLGRSLGHAAEVGLAHAPGRGMLGAPLRAGTAHVMPLGAIIGEQLSGHGAPQVGDGLADAWALVLLGHD